MFYSIKPVIYYIFWHKIHQFHYKNKQTNKKEPPKADPNKVYNIEIGDSFTIGPENAKVTIIEWMDFQWPYCAKSVSLIEEILEKYPNDVKVVFKNFPLGSHKQARKAAMYALAAGRQGKFKEMFHKIFAQNGWG